MNKIANSIHMEGSFISVVSPTGFFSMCEGNYWPVNKLLAYQDNTDLQDHINQQITEIYFLNADMFQVFTILQETANRGGAITFSSPHVY